MTIKFQGNYKSLKSFVSDELGDFTVITGKNGTGKSQLVQLLSSVKYPNNNPGIRISITPGIKNLQIEGIAFGNVQPLKGEQIVRQLEHSFSGFTNIKQELKFFFEELFSNGLKLQELQDQYFDIRPFMNGSSIIEKNSRVFQICQHYLGGLQHPFIATDEQSILSQVYKVSGNLFSARKALQSAILVADYKKKKIYELEKNDFYSSPLKETYYTNETPFSVQIENLFYGYARRRFVNELEYNRKVNHLITNESISDLEFIKKFPQPWAQINKILERHNIKLRVVEIKPEDFSPEIEFSFHLIEISSNLKITFEELSSGEKIIIGLIIRLFLTERYKDEFIFPDCIVFDEPDAFLHPEMSYLLLDVLYNTFVKELGIKIVLTTHSPSTVALTPEDCIFELQNVPITTLKKITKDSALKVLTGNLPLLSIDYNNHRQIFVESPTDQYYYQTIFNKLKADKKTLFDLYFITAGYGKSNCMEVIKLTNELRKAGNKTCYGIIDWDNTNSPSDYIIVNGYEKRYSIENFILDPIHLSILFIEQNCGNNISALGFDTSYNQYSLPLESEERLQSICEWFFKKIEIEFPAFKYENLISIEYGNAKKLNIPSWYLITKGHDIELKLKATFPSLTAFRNEGDLQKRLTDIASKCYPFISVDSINTLVDLSKNKK